VTPPVSGHTLLRLVADEIRFTARAIALRRAPERELELSSAPRILTVVAPSTFSEPSATAEC
jgi:hypothetical protein